MSLPGNRLTRISGGQLNLKNRVCIKQNKKQAVWFWAWIMVNGPSRAVNVQIGIWTFFAFASKKSVTPEEYLQV